MPLFAVRDLQGNHHPLEVCAIDENEAAEWYARKWGLPRDRKVSVTREKDFDPEYASMELTNDERDAIEKACSSLERDDRFYENEAASLRATLERLLERTK